MNDFDCQMAIIAQRRGSDEILGVARLSRPRRSDTADFALIIADKWQGQGIGRLLLAQLIDIGRKEGVRRIMGDILPDNARMKRLCHEMGFQVEYRPEDRLTRATLRLSEEHVAVPDDLIL
jgi:acetyltransferase